ncbi:MAG: SDR family NAD(P)-dependent oxidoreductase [Bradymonadia bacterium]
MMTVAIFGATSILGQKLAHAYAQQGANVIVAGRDQDETTTIAADVRVRNDVRTWAFHFDAERVEEHPKLIGDIEAEAGPIDVAILVFGEMGADDKVEDIENLKQIINVNYLGAASLCETLAARMIIRESGSIVGISSVAGDRGRQKNYHYGSAKGAFTLFLQGLRNRLHAHSVHVMTVRLGFVDTRLTYGQQSPLPSANPAKIADSIAKAQRRGAEDIYLPRFWRGIMGLIKSIPETYFKRMNV